MHFLVVQWCVLLFIYLFILYLVSVIVFWSTKIIDLWVISSRKLNLAGISWVNIMIEKRTFYDTSVFEKMYFVFLLYLRLQSQFFPNTYFYMCIFKIFQIIRSYLKTYAFFYVFGFSFYYYLVIVTKKKINKLFVKTWNTLLQFSLSFIQLISKLFVLILSYLK